MRKKLNTVVATYKGWDSAIDYAMREKVGRWPDFTAFGFRKDSKESTWNCSTASEAKRFKVKLGGLKKKGVSVEIV